MVCPSLRHIIPPPACSAPPPSGCRFFCLFFKVGEALTRAEKEAEEVEARHRAWMRQAQARQTELEANAAQLAEALAEANRKLPAGAEVRCDAGWRVGAGGGGVVVV